MIDFSAARQAMIDSQLRTSGVSARFAIDRMMAVPRENYVPAASQAMAYIDRSIPLDNGRRLAAPVFHGLLLTEAAPHADDRVLVVDSGAGYLAALVEPLVASVTVVTPDAPNAQDVRPFSLVLVDGAIEHVPDSLARQMADGGRIVTGMVDSGVTRLATGRKAGDSVTLLPLIEMGIPRMAEFDRPQVWSF